MSELEVTAQNDVSALFAVIFAGRGNGGAV
jgi:hypothetical protein